MRISDFGFAEKFHGRGKPQFESNMGTLEYFAPELVDNLLSLQDLLKKGSSDKEASKYCEAVDVWALGCICYELLQGDPPYYAEDEEEQLNLILRHDLKFGALFDQIDGTAVGLMRRMLDPSPDTRITMEEVISHPWIANTELLPSAPAEPSIRRSPAKRSRHTSRRPSRVLAAATSCAASRAASRVQSRAPSEPGCSPACGALVVHSWCTCGALVVCMHLYMHMHMRMHMWWTCGGLVVEVSLNCGKPDRRSPGSVRPALHAQSTRVQPD